MMEACRSVAFRLAVYALLLLGAFVAKAAPPIEFKGLPLGASLDRAKEMFPMLACVPGGDAGVTVCSEGNRYCAPKEAYENKADYEACQRANNALKTYAGLKIKRIALEFRDGAFTLARVYIDPGTYEQIVEALSTKYGIPTSVTTEPVQNRFGARYENARARWVLDDGHIGVNRYGGKLDTGIVILVSRSEVEQAAKKRPTPQQRSNDL